MSYLRSSLLLVVLSLAGCPAPTTAAPDAFAGTDGGASDGGHDAAASDAGRDAAMVDAFAPGIDGGLDGGSDGGVDGGFDAAMTPDVGTDAFASDVGLDAPVAPPDAAPPPVFSYASPLQVDVSTIFTVDTVASSAATGRAFPPLHEMDGSGYVFLTASLATSLGDATGGLPDDARFAGDANHPAVQLAWRDDGTAPNSVILNEPLGATSVTFPIVETSYTQVQLYLTSTEGTANVQVTLDYTDATSGAASFAVADWFGVPTSPMFVVRNGLSRFSTSGGDDFSHGASLFGVNLVVDPLRTLASITVRVSGGPGRVALYGATAY